MLLYSLLHLTGFAVSLDDLKHFRQWGSITPGHLEYGLTPGLKRQLAHWDRDLPMVSEWL